ncbi:MAG: hypothetical protein RI926_377 [Actinomycetota bacterium]|jgi:LPXTG-motif cell wall-anchored protein
MISRKKLASAVAVSVATAALLFPAGAAQAAPDPALWCWTMQSGNIKGTFLMSPNTPGDGTAPAATYTITGFSVYETNNQNVPLGSMATGEYSQGPMTPYQIVWSGSAVTTWQRNNNGNLLTNGILVSRPSITGYELHFGTNFQQANDPNTTYFTGNVTPTLSPAPSTGLCAGQVAPTPSPSPSPSSSSSTSQQTLANTGTQFPLFAGIAALMAGAAMLVLRRHSN